METKCNSALETERCADVLPSCAQRSDRSQGSDHESSRRTEAQP